MPYFSMAMRSMPMPQAKPWYRSGSMAAGADDVRVHHAAAENLQPVVALAEADLVADAPAADVDFHRRLGEREEARPEAHLHLVDLEERLAEFLQHPLQVADGGSSRR